MRTVGGFFYTLALAVWVGGGVLYTFVLTPAIFRAYPRNTAGNIVGTMMPFYFGAVLAATAVALIALAILWRACGPKIRAFSLAFLVVALAAQAYVQLRLYPEILAVKAQVASFEAEPDAPARQRFRSLHGTSMLLNLLTLADGTVLLALLPLLRR